MWAPTESQGLQKKCLLAPRLGQKPQEDSNSFVPLPPPVPGAGPSEGVQLRSRGTSKAEQSAQSRQGTVGGQLLLFYTGHSISVAPLTPCYAICHFYG